MVEHPGATDPPEDSPDPQPLSLTLSALEIDPTATPCPLDWGQLFGNDRPVELELGSGKGMFLRGAAQMTPETNFLGNERAGKYYRQAVLRLTRAALPNVRLFQADGLDLLDRWVVAESIAVLHVYFPDPWPKKRHHKRRIFRPELLAMAHRALCPEGEFRLATDHPEYRALIEELFAAHTGLFEPLQWDVTTGPAQLPTNYSRKWERAGRRLWWARFRKVPSRGGE